jgi:hypothetical protein
VIAENNIATAPAKPRKLKDTIGLIEVSALQPWDFSAKHDRYLEVIEELNR